MRTTEQHRLRVGVFVAVALGLAVLAVVAFTSAKLFARHDRYNIVFAETVLGLDEGANVYFNGIKVGEVTSLEVAPDNPAHVRLVIDVASDTQIREDTIAMLSLAGLTGVKVIDLHGSSATSPRLPPGSTITSQQSLLDRLQTQAEVLAQQSTELMTRANKIAANLETASADLTTVIDENRAALTRTIASVDRIARTLSALFDGRIAKLVDNTNGVVTDFGRVVKTNEAQLRAALADLRQASRNFKDLTRELRDKPSRLIYANPARDRKQP
jgi:phospholipid/cholesterol/gamma-HCH transport system substrate-binding protein